MRRNYCSHLGFSDFQLVVYYNKIEVRILPHLVFRIMKARFYNFGIICCPQTEARFEFFHRRRQHKNEDSLFGKGFFDVYCTLIVDVADYIDSL